MALTDHIHIQWITNKNYLTWTYTRRRPTRRCNFDRPSPWATCKLFSS